MDDGQISTWAAQPQNRTVKYLLDPWNFPLPEHDHSTHPLRQYSRQDTQSCPIPLFMGMQSLSSLYPSWTASYSEVIPSVLFLPYSTNMPTVAFLSFRPCGTHSNTAEFKLQIHNATAPFRRQRSLWVTWASGSAWCAGTEPNRHSLVEQVQFSLD